MQKLVQDALRDAHREATRGSAAPVPASTDTPVDLGAYRIAYPEAFGRNVMRLMEEGAKALQGLLERAQGTGPSYPTGTEWAEAVKLLSDVAQPWMADPVRLV